MARSKRAGKPAQKPRPKATSTKVETQGPDEAPPISEARRKRGRSQIALGATLVLASAIVTMVAIDGNVVSATTFAITYLPLVAGIAALVDGGVQLSRPAEPPRADARRWIYGVLGALFAVTYAVVVAKFIPNRLPSAMVHLWTLPLFCLAMAVGMLLGTRHGWWLALVAGSGLLASGILLILRIVVSAAYLSGVYGAFGKAAASGALLSVALVVELVMLLPACVVKYVLSRSGRRAYGMPT